MEHIREHPRYLKISNHMFVLRNIVYIGIGGLYENHNKKIVIYCVSNCGSGERLYSTCEEASKNYKIIIERISSNTSTIVDISDIF